jgi:hypothetical protein
MSLVSRRGDTTEHLSWKSFRRDWLVWGVIGSRYNRAGIRVAHPNMAIRGPHMDVWLPSTWTAPPVEELPALVEFLAATPDARRGLADTRRTGAILAQLATKQWIKPRVPDRPLMGDRLDIYIAVDRSLHDLGWRRFGGRPVKGEPLPAVTEIVRHAHLQLSPPVSRRVSEDQLTEAAQRHLETAPWPFDPLTA